MFKPQNAVYAACSMIFLSLSLPANAQSIISPDGERVFNEEGVPQYGGGESLFTFRYHPEEPDDPFGTLTGSAPNVIPLNPVRLFQEYEGREVIGAPGYDALLRQSAEGGFAGSFSDMVIEDLAVMQQNCIVDGAPIADADIKPVFSELRIDTNTIRGNAVVVVFSYKEIICDKDEDGEISNEERIPLKRRWVVSVLGGLEDGTISKQIGGKEFTYKLFAEGRNIRLLSYYSNLTLTGKRWQNDMRLIHGYDEFGNIDPRNRYYRPSANSCLDIDFLVRPKNDEDVISIHPSDVRFCARGCIPGDIDATK